MQLFFPHIIILNKEVIKPNRSIGKKILDGSQKELLRVACETAHQHHESWDGNGYPSGLHEHAISIFCADHYAG
ncbi:HD domain-containing phosphohydrolase [Halodesulfovibrio aestuarii]|uniref:HD domain-containing phosphohydrolase n=1 Tax=Halodesulfovibrio aestuarii TaxID=126333 RepID=A0ABV4JNM9_9BACT